MQFRVFTFPIAETGDMSSLNSFLQQHRIASVTKEIVRNGQSALLVFVVEYVVVGSQNEKKGLPRVDYREVLSTEEFELFSELREIRKRVAAEKGVPVYTVFNNAQLAEIVQKKIRTMSGFRGIDGIGDSRIEKFAEPFIAKLATVDIGSNANSSTMDQGSLSSGTNTSS